MTQDELAEAVGLSSHFVSAVENNRIADPSLSTVVALAKGLELTLGELVGGAELPGISENAPEIARMHDTVGREIQNAIRMILRSSVRKRGR